MQYSHINPRKQQFKENFEDSEANYSELDRPADQHSSGRPVQLIRIERNGQISVLPEALEILAGYNEPVGFASLAGKTRTGKSCLLNRLLHIKGEGVSLSLCKFRVDSSTSSCTEGIWMWSDPFRNEKYNNLIFFIDTEGTDSLVKDNDNDTKIFTLAVLISSFFMYNSVGSIDERSISELEMITALSKRIQTGEASSDPSQIARFMPKFMWLLRDFMLQLEDKNYRKISSNTYLENCLSEQNEGYNETSAKVKKSILTYFPIRQCLTLVRPVYEEELIYQMNQLEDHRLRSEFIDGVNALRKKIIDSTGPKVYNGKEITGPGISVMIQSYADAFNSGGVPNIRSAWEQISADEGNQAYRTALQVYERIYEQQIGEEHPYSDPEINKLTNKLRMETMGRFREEVSNNQQEHRDTERKLEEFIFNNEQVILQDNENVCERHNNNLINVHSQAIKTKLESQQYLGPEGAALLAKDIEDCKGKYNQGAVGRSQGGILAEFATTLTPIIMMIQTSNNPANDDRERKLAEQEQRRQMQLMDKKNKSRENQQASKERTDSRKKTLKELKREQQQKKKGGCCGSGCTLM